VPSICCPTELGCTPSCAMSSGFMKRYVSTTTLCERGAAQLQQRHSLAQKGPERQRYT
jgi:hypothetical protein